MKPYLLLTVLVGACALSACERESRRYQEGPAVATRPEATRITSLQPGKASPPPDAAQSSPYQNNAWGLAEGKRLFLAYNCNGCHAMGGGGIGPALMDAKWIYGYEPAQIYSTILQGRPNGMPAFTGRIPDQQIWQLVAYVQSLGGAVPKDAATSRDDDLPVKKAEQRQTHTEPKQTGHR
jgi:cytochrome c oxidase cbb3-type subunit III